MSHSKVFPAIPLQSIRFLKLLKKNNNREWFNTHKEAFLVAQQPIELFADALLAELNRHDVIETLSGKKSLGRIYRDTRFSGDKTPYKTNFGASIKKEGKKSDSYPGLLFPS